MITPALEILNQKGTPMFNSDLFANRPAAGIQGRIFIATDTKVFYRDTGTTWELIGGSGSGTVTGSGTAGTYALWTNTNAIGNSSLSEDGSYVISALPVKSNAFITNGGLAGQFVKGNGSLDSTQYQPFFSNNPVSGTGSATQVAFWLNNQTITGNNNLWFDDINGFLGIKNASPISELDVLGQGYFHNTLTASNPSNGWASSYASSIITIPAQSFTNLGNVFSGAVGVNNMTYQGNVTFANSNVPAAVFGNNIFKFSTSGITITTTPSGGGTRAFAAVTAFNQIQSSNQGTITNLAGFYNTAPYATNQLLNVTNYYGVLLNDSAERTAFTITNKWGIYQEGSTDKNYFNGNVLIKSNVDNGNALQVTGNATLTGTITGTGTIQSNDQNAFWLYQSGNPVDTKYWAIQNLASTGTFRIRALNDAVTSGINAIEISRSGISSVTTAFMGGNVGIGVTPSAWFSGWKALQGGSNSSFAIASGGEGMYSMSNLYLNASAQWTYTNNGYGSVYQQYAGEHYWYTAPSGIAGNVATLSRPMTLFANGNLGINTTTDNGSKLQVNGISSFNGNMSLLTGNNLYIVAGDISFQSNAGYGVNTANGQKLASFQNYLFTITGISKSTFPDQGNARLIVENTATGGQSVNLIAGNPNVDNTGFSIAYGNTNILRFDNNSAATFANTIKTASPSGGTAQPFKLGSYVAGITAGTGYVQIEINGTTYKLIAST